MYLIGKKKKQTHHFCKAYEIPQLIYVQSDYKNTTFLQNETALFKSGCLCYQNISFTFVTSPLLLSYLYKKFSTKFSGDMYLI